MELLDSSVRKNYMQNLSILLKKLRKFTKERDWEQFHNHKDLAISLSLEAAEVLEHFQWKSPQEVEDYCKTHKDHIADEIADVLKYLISLSDNLGVKDIVAVAIKKLEKDALKYPVQKAKGKHTKYTDL